MVAQWEVTHAYSAIFIGDEHLVKLFKRLVAWKFSGCILYVNGDVWNDYIMMLCGETHASPLLTVRLATA